jgi:thioredoxin-like negative regulator of GroEL
MNHIEIEKYRPCSEALRFRMQYQNFQDAWQACPRGDWMLWIAQRVGVDLRTLTRAKALCALTVSHLMKDERSVRACEVALKFADGEATREELAAAAAAAAYAADDAAAAADAADARIKSQQQTADICREHLTSAVFEKLNLL